MQKWFIYESLPQISFLVMKVVSYGLAQRILVIHGGLTREYPKYPLTQSVGRENLSGESLVSCAPSRFSLEILPPSLLRSGIFTDTHSFAPEYYRILCTAQGTLMMELTGTSFSQSLTCLIPDEELPVVGSLGIIFFDVAILDVVLQAGLVPHF